MYISPILHRVVHTGVDYAAASGTPVRATGDGIISFAGGRGGYGNLVEVRHPNGYSTRYAHLSRIAPGVEPGAAVRQGAGRPVDPARVASEGGLVTELRAEPGWAAQRRRLAQLLARAPTTFTVQREGLRK